MRPKAFGVCLQRGPQLRHYGSGRHVVFCGSQSSTEGTDVIFNTTHGASSDAGGGDVEANEIRGRGKKNGGRKGRTSAPKAKIANP